MFQLFRLLICQNVKLGKCEDGLSRHQKKTQDAKFLSDRVSPQQEEEGQGERRRKLNCEIYCDIFSTVQGRFWRWGQWKWRGKVKKNLKVGEWGRGSWAGGRGRFSCNTRTTRFQGRCHHQRHCHRHHHYHDIVFIIVIVFAITIIILVVSSSSSSSL